MIKNNGVLNNQLSNLDFGGVLRDSHNLDLHALDVNVVSGLVPSSFSKVVPTNDEYGRISNVKYYGLGLNKVINLVIPSNAQGKSEITTFAFTGLTPANLAGKYVSIYDSNGKVIPWFNLDNGNTEPVVSGASRYVEISIATGDSVLDMANKFSTTLNSDLEFSTTQMSSLVLVQDVVVGVRTAATSGDSPLLVSVGQAGENSLSGTLFYLWKYDNSGKYAFYFNIDGNASVPVYSGISITEIVLLGTDSVAQIATKTATGTSTIPYFKATATDGGQLQVVYRTSGNSTGFLDVNTNITSENVQSGQDLQLVQELVITYPTICGTPIIEALL